MDIEQPLDEMTWGELRAFVALGAGISDAAPVEIACGEYDTSIRALAIRHLDATVLLAADQETTSGA